MGQEPKYVIVHEMKKKRGFVRSSQRDFRYVHLLRHTPSSSLGLGRWRFVRAGGCEIF